MIHNEARLRPYYFICADRRANTAAANCDATFDLAVRNRLCQRDDEIGIVIGRI